MWKMLVVDGDPVLNKSIGAFFIRNGFNVTGSPDIQNAYDILNSNVYDIIICDCAKESDESFDFAKNIRTVNRETPIMFISSESDYITKQKAFYAGCDDFMVKPLDLNEALLRVNALLRRAGIAKGKRLTVGSLSMNMDEYRAAINGETVPMSVKEFNILYKLLSYPNKTFTRIQLMDEFWAADSSTGQRTVDVYITKLRDKTSSCKDFRIVTVHGLGYKAIIDENAVLTIDN